MTRSMLKILAKRILLYATVANLFA
jgi:hypothetical protein